MQVGEWDGRIELAFYHGVRKAEGDRSSIHFPYDGTIEDGAPAVVFDGDGYRVANLDAQVQVGDQHAGQAQIDHGGRRRLISEGDRSRYESLCVFREVGDDDPESQTLFFSSQQ